MLFKIVDLDEPLHVAEPIKCKLCLTNRQNASRVCVHCETMKHAVKALMHLELAQINLFGGYNAGSRKDNTKLTTSIITSRVSCLTRG